MSLLGEMAILGVKNIMGAVGPIQRIFPDIWGFTERAGVYISGPDWAETSVIGSQHIGAPKLGMGPRASNRFRRCSVSAISGGGTALAQGPYKICRSHR